MTQLNLNKIAALLTDTFVSIEEISIIENHFVVSYFTKTGKVDVAFAPVPKKNDQETVCLLLVKLQNQIARNIHPSYYVQQ